MTESAVKVNGTSGTVAVLMVAMAFWTSSAAARTYYVDAVGGDDDFSGCEPECAWRTIGRVNRAELQPGDSVLFRRGGLWRGETLIPKSGSEGNPVCYGAYGDGEKPIFQGSVDLSDAGIWLEHATNVWTVDPEKVALSLDIGSIVLDHGPKTGWRKWKMEDLIADDDYFYDRDAKRLYYRSEGNPASRCWSMEAAQNMRLVDQSRCSNVVYEGIWLRYANFAFGGGSTRRLTIRDCDMCYIGGCCHRVYPDGYHARFGNAVEFWGGCSSNLVEHCRIWEVYDAALTHQNQDYVQTEEFITYRDNIIWNCEFSFEYWNRPAESKTRHIVFEHNTCVDAGCEWSRRERQDKNAAHLMFYWCDATNEDFVVRNNVFVGSKDYLFRMDTDWCAALKIDHNLWWATDGEPVCYWQMSEKISDFEEYKRKLKVAETGSVFARPEFVDAAGRNYRLKPGSVGSNLASDGGPMGARLGR